MKTAFSLILKGINMSVITRYVTAAIAYGVWLWLVIAYHADMKEYITWLQYAIAALAAGHLVSPAIGSALASRMNPTPKPETPAATPTEKQ